MQKNRVGCNDEINEQGIFLFEFELFVSYLDQLIEYFTLS